MVNLIIEVIKSLTIKYLSLKYYKKCSKGNQINCKLLFHILKVEDMALYTNGTGFVNLFMHWNQVRTNLEKWMFIETLKKKNLFTIQVKLIK